MMNGHKFDFPSDVINIFVLIYDYSGSMDCHENAIIEANKAFYSDFSRFEEKNSVAISKVCFTEHVTMSPFGPVSNFDTCYYANGGTRLYRAIIHAGEETIEYYTQLMKRLGIRARITFLVFTDGEDNENRPEEIEAAKKMITQLNSLEATTVFIAFDQAIEAKDGEKLGFTCTRDISTAEELISCLGIELSQSCKEQSRSAVSLQSKFFSKVATTQQDDSDTPGEDDMLGDNFFDV